MAPFLNCKFTLEASSIVVPLNLHRPFGEAGVERIHLAEEIAGEVEGVSSLLQMLAAAHLLVNPPRYEIGSAKPASR
jgi:hypothetical protein